eukprot:scaffold34634_cov171-Amphora_coffeaeformis.AAC.5
MVVSWVGAEAMVLCGRIGEGENIVTRVVGTIEHKKLDRTSMHYMLAYSVVFSLNIAIGNVSLKHVSVNFNQVMRSLSPAATMAVSMVCFGKQFSASRKLATVPVMVGVALACLGDMSNTRIGVFYTVLAVFLAAAKCVASGELLAGSLKLHPVDLLGRIMCKKLKTRKRRDRSLTVFVLQQRAPLASAQCLLMAYLTGEVADISQRWTAELNPFVDYRPFLVVTFSALAAFGLNISSLQTNKLTSPLTMTIAANVKQVLMMVLSTFLFNTHVSPLNGLGMGITLAASAGYSYVSLTETEQANDSIKYEPLKVLNGSDEDGDDDTNRTSDDDSETDRSSDDDFSEAIPLRQRTLPLNV